MKMPVQFCVVLWGLPWPGINVLVKLRPLQSSRVGGGDDAGRTSAGLGGVLIARDVDLVDHYE